MGKIDPLPFREIHDARVKTGVERMIPPFCSEYLKLQGVQILPNSPRPGKKVFAKPEPEFVPKVNQYTGDHL